MASPAPARDHGAPPDPRSRRPPRLRARRYLAQARRLLRLKHDTWEQGAVRQITANVDFRGSNLWALVFAILVASIGLNVNSTAVIIGAMLISPLMGPIMGAGLGLGMNDLALVRRSVRNLAIAALVSIVTSAAYFALSPLTEAQSELLARTRPTIYDVLIAVTGGSAGIIAATRRGGGGNAVPGVAIATALMPPLCTVGFGISQGAWGFALGAFYLFVINAVFICLSTLAFVRLMGFERVVDLDPQHARRIRMAIMAIITVTVLPSIYAAWMIVQQTRFESSARRFVQEQITGPDRAVISTSVRRQRDSGVVEVTAIGRAVPPDSLQQLEQRLATYGLQRTRLRLREPGDPSVLARRLGDSLRAGIVADLERSRSVVTQLDARLRSLETSRLAMPVDLTALTTEVTTLVPGIISLATLTAPADSALPILVAWRANGAVAERRRVEQYLALRLAPRAVRVTHAVTR